MTNFTAKNTDGKFVELNGNEVKVYLEIANGDEYDGRPTLHSADVSVEGLSAEQIKGYLSSLNKKSVIVECELPNEIMAWQVIDKRHFCWSN